MPYKKIKKQKRYNYLVGLFMDPFIIGKWKIVDKNAHSVRVALTFYYSIFFQFGLLLTFLTSCSMLTLLIYSQEAIVIRNAPISVLAFLFLYIISIFIRKNCLCPLCRAAPLLDGKSYKHQKACKIKPLNYAYTAMLSIILRRSFRCQHCGTPFTLKKK